MKNLALLFCLLFGLSCISAFGQVPSYFKDGARWVYATFRFDDSPPREYWNTKTQHIIQGDTMIGSIAYCQLFTTNMVEHSFNSYPPFKTTYYDSIGPQYIRHDTLLNRVYFLPHTDSTETLLFDFNAQVGETIPLISTVGYLTIDSITKKQFWMDSVKYFHYSAYGNSDWNYLIEGLGSTSGLLNLAPQFPSLSGGTFTNLMCFQLGDSIFDRNGSGCPFLALPNSIADTKVNLHATLGPNPFSSMLSLSLETENPGPANISIRNLLGQEVFRRTETLLSSNTTKTFDLSHLTSGLYFVEISTGEHRWMKPVVKE